MDIMQHPVALPKVVAIATDWNQNRPYSFSDPDIPGPAPKYGQDITFRTNGVAPNGENVGSTEAELKPKMYNLLAYFAHADSSGMTQRLFDIFLTKHNKVEYYQSADLNAAVAAHENMERFCFQALGASWPFEPPAGKTRIHQALEAAKWDVKQLVAPTYVGTPNFNLGDKYTVRHWGDSTGDWANGLALMINGVQHIYVIATHYYYDKDDGSYTIRLKFVGLDVFGLDDSDVNKYGAKEDNWHTNNAKIGITAWWQLQHQHGYAPLVTRFVVERTFTRSVT